MRNKKEEDAIQKQIENLKNEGVTYYYDRSERLNKRRQKSNTAHASNRVFQYGLITIIIMCLFLVILWFTSNFLE